MSEKNRRGRYAKNSQDYLRKLDRALKGIPPEERANAISFYFEYFEDAGLEHEAEAMNALGSPAQLAAGIKADIAMRDLGEGAPKVRKGVSAIWLAVLGVFAAPMALPLAIVGFAIVFALLVSLLAILISLIVSGVAIALSGAVMLLISFILIPQDVGAAMFYGGWGLFMAGVGVLFMFLMIWLFRVSTKGIAKLFNRIRRKKTKYPPAPSHKTPASGGTAQETPPPAPQEQGTSSAYPNGMPAPGGTAQETPPPAPGEDERAIQEGVRYHG
jgi:uncharacterized membrane protein